MIRPTQSEKPPDSLDKWIEQACESDPLPAYVEEPQWERGPPLTKSELPTAQAQLSKWQAPAEFVQATNTLCDRCGSEDWFNRPHLKFLHDAYVLAEFAFLTRVDSVRLADSSEQWPDGYVKVGGKAHNVEITSTHGGRKLGQEYRDVKEPTLDPVTNWVARAESIPHHLDAAISAKSKKKYGSPCWLVVYLNINERDIRQTETERAIAAIKARYSESFEAITVLWKEKLY
ncbi:MAG TPA: hypothetical protein VNZ48_06855 [Xanthobacteraceae bacterium]|jgi:hypothetical protein|nr:hypothetical protein [Xanthobacteraceae bacterium]